MEHGVAGDGPQAAAAALADPDDLAPSAELQAAPPIDVIPLVDVPAQQREVAVEVMAGFEGVIERAEFVSGREVGVFEATWASFCGVRHCLGVANGTDALALALRAVGVGPGDEVVIPAMTFVATAEAVVHAGATPVVVDVDARHLMMDVDKAEAAIGPRTRALLAVDLYGQVAPMESLEALARHAGVALIEDAAQAHGAMRHGRRAGSFGLAAGMSFYPGKNLGAYGDAGAVLTDDDDIAGRVRLLRNHGSDTQYQHEVLGFNSRLDTLQAVVLSAKAARLVEWNQQRREAAARYDEMLRELPGVVLPSTLRGNEHVWHLYVVRVPRRDEVLQRLRDAGIHAAVHYPSPVHLQGALARLGYRRGDLPVSEAAARQILSLPLFPRISAAQQERVAARLQSALRAVA
jgi:dTDP-4-amino-4,6-dideoxygalactose transaminase